MKNVASRRGGSPPTGRVLSTSGHAGRAERTLPIPCPRSVGRCGRARVSGGAGGRQRRRRMPDESTQRASVRASDADREAAVRRLEQALGEGRITVGEFQQRGGAAGGAV